jgi:hypothetical protein
VPLSLARGHVDAAIKAGDRARLIVVPAIGHFESASPRSSAWPTILEVLRSLVANLIDREPSDLPVQSDTPADGPHV